MILKFTFLLSMRKKGTSLQDSQPVYGDRKSKGVKTSMTDRSKYLTKNRLSAGKDLVTKFWYRKSRLLDT